VKQRLDRILKDVGGPEDCGDLANHKLLEHIIFLSHRGNSL